MKVNKVAIIGGGLAGISVFAELVHASIIEGIFNLEITIFDIPKYANEFENEELKARFRKVEENFNIDPRMAIGPGSPYNIGLPENFIFNAENDNVAYVKSPNAYFDFEDFYEWMQQNKKAIAQLFPSFTDNKRKRHQLHSIENKKGYVPRSLYGIYLAVRYKEVRAYAKSNNITVQEIRYPVINIQRKNHQLCLLYRNECSVEEYVSDQVVLATGPFQKPIPENLKNNPRVFSAYPPHHYTRLLQEKRMTLNAPIVIVGTGLTASEVALELLEQGARCIYMISRKGQLRPVRGRTTNRPLQYLTILALEERAKTRGDNDNNYLYFDDVVELFIKEIEAAYHQVERTPKIDLSYENLSSKYGYLPSVNWNEVLMSSDVLKQLEYNITEVETSEEIVWRSVCTSVLDISRQIYIRFNKDDKKRFDKFKGTFVSYATPMPLPTAKKLLEAIKDRRLKVVGDVREIQQESEHISILFDQELDLGLDKQVTKELIPELVIFATGLSAGELTLSLYKNMIQSGFVSPHPRVGIKFNTETVQVQNMEGDVDKLYAIGQPTMGYLLANSQTKFLASLACVIANKIIQSLFLERVRGAPSAAHLL